MIYNGKVTGDVMEKKLIYKAWNFKHISKSILNYFIFLERSWRFVYSLEIDVCKSLRPHACMWIIFFIKLLNFFFSNEIFLDKKQQLDDKSITRKFYF